MQGKPVLDENGKPVPPPPPALLVAYGEPLMRQLELAWAYLLLRLAEHDPPSVDSSGAPLKPTSRVQLLEAATRLMDTMEQVLLGLETASATGEDASPPSPKNKGKKKVADEQPDEEAAAPVVSVLLHSSCARSACNLFVNSFSISIRAINVGD